MYYDYISDPIDLNTIEKKRRANVYTTPQALLADLTLMFENAMAFNEVCWATGLRPPNAALQLTTTLSFPHPTRRALTSTTTPRHCFLRSTALLAT